MKKSLFFFLSLFICCNALTAQTFSWLRQGGYNQTLGYDSKVAIDNHHNVVCGFYTNYYYPVFGTDTLYSLAHDAAVIAKYDSSGSFLWAKIITAHNNGCSMEAMAVDKEDNIYIAGNFSTNPLYLTPTDSIIGTDNIRNGYIAKFDDNGNFLWAKDFPAKTGYGMGTNCAMTIDADDNLIYYADFYSKIHLSDTSVNTVFQGLVFIKYKPDGTRVWVRKADGDNHVQATGISCDAANNIYFSGKLTQDIDFGTMSFSYTNLAGFVGKYDKDGNFKWFKKTEGNIYAPTGISMFGNYLKDVVADKAGNVYVTGGIVDSGSYSDTVLGHWGKQFLYYAKYNTNGVLQWEHKYGGGGKYYTIGHFSYDDAYAIDLDRCGYPYITGNFYDTISMGGFFLNNDTTMSCYVMKVDTANGLPLWIKTSVGGKDNFALNISVDKGNGNIACTGRFNHDITFDTLSESFSQYNAADDNFYLLQIYNPVNCPATDTGQGVAYMNAANDIPIIYPNPTYGELHVDFYNKKERTISISDLLGQRLNNYVTSSQTLSLNISNYPPGVYFLTILDTQKHTKTINKFIKY